MASRSLSGRKDDPEPLCVTRDGFCLVPILILNKECERGRKNESEPRR